MEEAEKQPHPPNGIVRAVPIPSLRGGRIGLDQGRSRIALPLAGSLYTHFQSDATPPLRDFIAGLSNLVSSWPIHLEQRLKEQPIPSLLERRMKGWSDQTSLYP